MATYISACALRVAQGKSTDDVFQAFCDGQSGVLELQHLDSSQYQCQHAYEISDDSELQLRSTRWLVDVVREVVSDAGIDFERERVAILVGTGLREQSSLERHHADDLPFELKNWHYQHALEQALGLAVPVYTFVNACAASLCTLALGQDMLELQQYDRVIIAGTDSIAESMYGLLDRANPKAPRQLVPFQQDRLGVIMGEGAAAVVIQSSANGAMARLHSTALNCDASHETAPDLQGMTSAIELAHQRTGIAPEQIDLIMAHGTGTDLNDDTESQALADVFASAAGDVYLSGLKALTGHTAGASGLVGMISGLKSMHTGTIPPTLGLTKPIASSQAFNLVTERVDGANVRFVQVNAFGFGGVNAVSILERV